MIFKRIKKIPDHEIVLHYQEDKDKKWMGELYRRYAHLVFGVCLKYLQNKEKAQDATSAIFEELIEKLQSQKIESFGSWIYSISKNYCLMELRKRKTAKHGVEMGIHLSVDQISLPDETGGLEYKILQEIDYEKMESAIENLPIDQKKCIVLFYLEQQSYNQVAEQTGYSLNQVKSAIQNGKRNLKNRLIKKT